jgi:hypothetical protein
MRKSLITFFLHVFSLLALGQEQVKSFYFPPSLNEPTQYSAHQFDQFKQSIDSGQVHIMEINAFTDSSGSSLANYTLANARLTYFTSRLIIDSSVKLKVDFVNDIATHFGGLTETKLFFRTDSVRNILSNKVSALFRLAAKDLVDLVFLSYRFQFDWSEIVDEAREKDSGIEVSIVAEILSSFPVQKLDEIFWVAPPDVKKIQNDIQQMAKDCLEVKSNSLCSI